MYFVYDARRRMFVKWTSTRPTRQGPRLCAGWCRELERAEGWKNPHAAKRMARRLNTLPEGGEIAAVDERVARALEEIEREAREAES